MKLILALTSMLLASICGLFYSLNGTDKYSKIENNEYVSYIEIPQNMSVENKLTTYKNIPKTAVTEQTIVLEKTNTVSIVGPVTQSSMATAMQELAEVSENISVTEPIYLVLNTPGGSVFAGLDFIDYAKAIPNKIITVTKFAASMGFQIVQNMEDRLITNSGVLMSHRARGGVQGQFDGELEQRYKMVKDAIDRLDYIAAKRMDLSVKEYKALIKDEFWSNGFRSVNNKSADKVVSARCGSSMLGKKTVTVRTFFGASKVTVSKCPLIYGAIVDPDNKLSSEQESVILKSFNNPQKYVDDYITTGRHYRFYE